MDNMVEESMYDPEYFTYINELRKERKQPLMTWEEYVELVDSTREDV